MKFLSKKVAKMLLILMLVVSMVFGFNPIATFAADARSASFSLYFNSPFSTNLTSAVYEMVYYAGTNYFAVDGISGSSRVKIVTCSGVDVNMSAIQMTSTGITGFTCTPQSAGQIAVKFRITLTNDGLSTAYAHGRIYY